MFPYLLVFVGIHVKLALCESVRFDFGHHFHPFVSQTENLAVLNHTGKEKTQMQLKCMASYPTEWIANFDDVSVGAGGSYKANINTQPWFVVFSECTGSISS